MVVSESSSREAAGQMQKTQMSSVGELGKFGGETSPLGHNHLRKSFWCILGDVGDAELEWNVFKASIWKWLSRAVFRRSWVPVRVASSEPAGGHKKVVDINSSNEVFPESGCHRENMQTPHLRDRVRTQREFGVEPLLVCVKKCQLGWFQHLIRMPPGRFPSDIFWTSPC